MARLLQNLIVVLAAARLATTISIARSYPVPATVPKTAAKLHPAPIGVSIEFYMWPSYMTNVSQSLKCFEHFSNLYGLNIPVRIGGTTQDRATYDPDFDGYVSYHDPDPLIPPMELSYGPRFFDLIGEYKHEVMLGFNRGDNNRTNTFTAVMEAKSRAEKYLWAIELGNEPDLYYYVWKKPVAVAPWNATQEGADNADWAQDFINIYKPSKPLLSAGGYAVPFSIVDEPLEWPNTNYLIATAYNGTIKNYTQHYCGHLYALSNSTLLSEEMAHNKTTKDVAELEHYVAAAHKAGRPYILGETNFHGIDVEMDASFGAALQTLDKSLWAVSRGIEQLYYHQGTINQANFNWFLTNQINTPFYGGYLSAVALANASHIIASDGGNDLFAQYVIYDAAGKPERVVLINTEYYSGEGARPSAIFTLTGLKHNCGTNVHGLRMTAPSSDSKTTKEQNDPTKEAIIAGQWFQNNNCEIKGEKNVELHEVKDDGELEVEVFASEAVLIYL